MKRCTSLFISQVDLGSVLEQQADDIWVSIRSRDYCEEHGRPGSVGIVISCPYVDYFFADLQSLSPLQQSLRVAHEALRADHVHAGEASVWLAFAANL